MKAKRKAIRAAKQKTGYGWKNWRKWIAFKRREA